MGLESLPYLALGNTKKGMTKIVMSPDGENSGESNNSGQWLVNQKNDIKYGLWQTGQAAFATHTKSLNKICYESHIYSPTIKSLEYFSEVTGLISSHRESLKLLTVKNPISFGSSVLRSTKKVVRELGGRVSYYAPSGIVGLESAKKGMLVRDSFFVDYNSKKAIDYADKSEAKLNTLDMIIKSINDHIDEVVEATVDGSSPTIADAVSVVLDLYHLSIQDSVKAGLTYTVIEDVWLNKKIYHARDFAPKMLALYEYAEKNSVIYSTPYPSYDPVKGELSANKELSLSDSKERALYTEVFDCIKGKVVTSTSGNRYQMGHLIPQNLYLDRLILDLERFLSHIKHSEDLNSVLCTI